MRVRDARTAALRWTALVAGAALLVTGCSGSASAGDPAAAPSTAADETAESATDVDAAPEGDDEAVSASCDWDQPRLAAGSPSAPTGRAGDLAEALIGAWQHTHTDTAGGGYQPLQDTTDIRFVFPSAESMVYCQKIGEGEANERTGSVNLAGDAIELPDPAPGYTAVAWSGEVMLWQNHALPDETYLLRRR